MNVNKIENKATTMSNQFKRSKKNKNNMTFPHDLNFLCAYKIDFGQPIF